MVCCLLRDPSSTVPAAGRLQGVARASSPRVETHGDEAVIFDVDGLSRVCGPPDVVAREVAAMAASQGMTVRVALAGTSTAAWVLAHARPGITVVAPGAEAAKLAPLPIGWLGVVADLDRVRLPLAPAPAVSAVSGEKSEVAPHRGRGRAGSGHFRAAPAPPAAPVRPIAVGAAEADRRTVDLYRERLATFERWGIRRCGDLAALPRADIHARMGPSGVRLHLAARGEDIAPLVPMDEARVFTDRVELEWPIEGLEPLSFVLARQCDRLSAALEAADRGAVSMETRLTLVTRDTHVRVLSVPAPLRDSRVLRTLILLDLESHPPPAGIDVVELTLGVTPGRIVQGSLLARTLPSPENLTTLIARLGALMGESRVGAPKLLDTHDTRQVAIGLFRLPAESRAVVADATPAPEAGPGRGGTIRPSFRRFRLPIAAAVAIDGGVPVRVSASSREVGGGAVVSCAGPWRSSGAWWDLNRVGWDRDEWDVELADGGVYRLARDRTRGTWEIEGLFD